MMNPLMAGVSNSAARQPKGRQTLRRQEKINPWIAQALLAGVLLAPTAGFAVPPESPPPPEKPESAVSPPPTPYLLPALPPPPADELPPAPNPLDAALELMREKKYADAIPPLEALRESTPTLEAVWEALGWCYYHTGRAEETERLWQQYLLLRPHSAKAHSLLAQLAVLRRDWRKADAHLSASLALEPQNYDLRFWYAQNLFRLGRLEDALPIFETLWQENPRRHDVQVDLARLYVLLQRYEDSLDLWIQVVAVEPDNLNYRTEYARALMLVGSLDAAGEEARQILEQDHTRWDVMNLRADLAEISMSPAAMVRALRELIAEAQDPEVRARLRVRLGARLVALHRRNPKLWPLTLGLDQYEEAITVLPNYVPWLNQYAQIALMAHQPHKARRATDRILKDLNPYNAQARHTRFELALFERNYDEAEQLLETLYRDFQPDNPYRFFDLARLEVQRGRYDEAMEALDRFEAAGAHGAVLTLLYHGLTESEWMALTSSRRLREHLTALRQAGFTFLAPRQVPDYLARQAKATTERPEPRPLPARLLDGLFHAFTGRRRTPTPEDRRPAKVAVITFDDGLRSSFQIGTPIARDLNIPFGMFIITSLEELNAPMYAAWEEIRAAHESGLWEVGSHLMHANTEQPSGPPPAPNVFPLANLVWREDHQRLETLREWSRRVRNEFVESRRRLEEHLGLPPGAPLAVAYPYGDIGQEEGSNVARWINPIRAILTEADRTYQAGFIVDRFGYTCAGENPLLIRRYEPRWDEEASELIESVLDNHPVFLARRTRAEIAALMNKPYLAQREIERLRRDGYPPRLLRELIARTTRQIPAPETAGAEEPDRPAASRLRLKPSNAFVAGSYRENKSHRDILQRFGEGRAGLNLTAALGLEASYRAGTIEQTVTSNLWFTIERPATTVSSSTTTSTTDGETTTTSTTTETTVLNRIQTNRTERYEYEADLVEIRAVSTLRIHEAATMTLSLGQKILTLQPGTARETEKEEMVGSAVVSWQPYRPLQLTAAYEHDLVPSAREKIVYDGFAFIPRWKISDDWETTLSARYLHYADDNAMLQLSGSSFWQLFPRPGIWAGLEAASFTTDEKSDLYWTPYWDTRYAAVARYRRAYQDYFFQFDILLGRQSEKGRPEEMDAWRNLKARAEADGNWDPGPTPGSKGDPFMGLRGTYRQRIWRRLDLIGDLNVSFLRDYSEHDFTLGLQLNF